MINYIQNNAPEDYHLFLNVLKWLKKDYEDTLRDGSKMIDVRFNTIVDELLKEEEVEDFRSDIKRLSKKITYVMHNYLQGDVMNAYDECGKILKKYLKDTYLVNIRKGQILFRGRASNSMELYKRKEIFHVPLNRRTLVKKQRFSIDGFPCLYLGKSIYICWDELGKPNPLTCNFSVIQSVKDIPILDLCIPLKYGNKNDYCKLLIVIACSMSAQKDVASIQEYIFPQIILHSLIGDKNLRDKYWGVSYFSSKIYMNDYPYEVEKIENDIKNHINYVIPVRDITSKSDYCEALASNFDVSFPISILHYQLFTSKMSVGLGNGSDKNYYKNTDFALLEESLKNSLKDYIDNFGTMRINDKRDWNNKIESSLPSKLSIGDVGFSYEDSQDDCNKIVRVLQIMENKYGDKREGPIEDDELLDYYIKIFKKALLQ